ncbi:hypothetical protein [uncultured Litoreibacter sp.]|uniref:anti-sigma factor family protein n=1 Tax=uncultured Litoreibacter sp. TaxID=1392394 RepID=UPI002601C3FD|nr:hypothetical protein [uncultured Litoreibacter sp.]
MNELNEKDWELINAYHDGELNDAERVALESRLRSEPALNEALNDISSVSASLGALRPQKRPSPSEKVVVAANQNRRPTRWLVGSAVAAAIAMAVVLGPQVFKEPSVFDVHAEFVEETFAFDSGNVVQVTATNSQNAPDLASANLTPVALRQVDEGNVTHYAGRNGCRLSYFRGTFEQDGLPPSNGVQVASWTTTDDMNHMIVATGMDQGKFDAIADYLRLVTRQQASEQMLASLVETTANAESCVG